MGKMSTANIMGAMKKAKQKTDALKFAPKPEDLPLQVLTPHPHNEFAKQDTAADIEEMRGNIENIGLINPIAVSHRDEKYYILSGECRYRAIVLINAANPEKYNYVRATVYENLSAAQEMLILNSANLKARSYTAAQRLAYFQSLKNFLEAEKEAGQYDGPMQVDIAESMGISDRQVRKYEQINEQFTDAEKQKIVDGEMSVDTAAKEAVARRQKKKDKVAGSASGYKPEISFWEPYIRELILFFKSRHGEILNYYQKQQRSAADGVAFLKSILNNCGGARDYSNGNGCMYDFGGSKLQLDVAEYSADREKIMKRHRKQFSWTQVEKIVRQMIIDGSLKRKPVKKEGEREVLSVQQAELSVAEPDLVSLALPSDVGKPPENTGDASADDLYQHTYNDVLRLMEALKETDSASYEEVARLYGKIMHVMRQKGHKVNPDVTEDASFVHCKDCVNCRREQSGEQNLICEEHGCVTTEMDFCSWGEPKENKEA